MAKASPKIVIIGGGYGGIAAAKALDTMGKFDVTLVTAKEVFVHCIGGLRASCSEAEVNTDRILIPYGGLMKKGGKVVHSKATKIVFTDTDKAVELANGESLPYDYLILATGMLSSKTLGTGGAETSREAIKQLYQKRREALKAASSILVVGGGPVGIELCGEIMEFLPGKTVTLVSSNELMANPYVTFKPKLAASLREKLQAKGVTVLFNAGRVEFDKDAVDETGLIVGKHTYKWSSGEVEVDALAVAVGASEPSSLYADSGLGAWVDDQGRLKVDRTFQVEGTSGKVFAIGDCNNLPIPKMGYTAGVCGVAVAGNILMDFKGKGLKQVVPPATAMTIVPIGSSGGAGQLVVPVVGDFITKTLKAKDLFIGRTWGDFGAGKPPAAA